MTTEQYVERLLGEDIDLERVIRVISEQGMPDISIAAGYGRLLTMLVRTSGAKNVLEIGALGGYSGICLARGLTEGGQLTSLELVQQYADVARGNLEAAGFGGQVSYIVGDAKVSLAELKEQGKKFDFFFIDADKENYPVYLELAISLANPGAIITGDNALLHGRTIDPEKNGPSVLAMRQFNERMVNDERLIGTLLPAYDGLAVAVVK
ncbi:O-methyltransferase [Paenibacillus baekrokdamisoli]|uniref:O-methyltransferase n=1 Tax=Paenibacillus baekrokdamisoli TaxID=1712516 RepID=A0A3G9ILB0_9BACL|nr:O-methyltransferase [Paenibacillus baekrokdamisoli]MBB3067699.1 putative O-methyltransferase YrrM [Paenibacillus baekrokdamisoli]BBH19116.1 O-methyltransferase [Paenibacillus baekrokdamisoli]